MVRVHNRFSQANIVEPSIESQGGLGKHWSSLTSFGIIPARNGQSHSRENISRSGGCPDGYDLYLRIYDGLSRKFVPKSFSQPEVF